MRAIVTAVCAVTLVFLVVVTTSWNLSHTTRNRALLSLFPQDPSVTYGDAIDELHASNGRALPSILPIVDRAVHLDPLDGRPLFLHALKQILNQRSEPPIAALEASRHLSPRLTETRLLLLDVYGRSGRAGDAIGEAQSLMNLMPQEHSLIVRLIAGLAGRPGGVEALARALPTSDVKGEVMLRLAQTGTDSALLERLAEAMRGIALDPSERDWIGRLVEKVANRPDPASARSLWAIFYDVSPTRVGAALSDPEFKHSGSNPPFDWSVKSSEAGTAQIRNGNLEVYYYGRSSAIFASQMLMLTPGNYSLTSRVTSSDAEAPRGMSWQLACLGQHKPLATARLATFMASSGGAVPFSIPASGCTAQNLQLTGTPSDLPRNQSARIQRVQIRQAVP